MAESAFPRATKEFKRPGAEQTPGVAAVLANVAQRAQESGDWKWAFQNFVSLLEQLSRAPEVQAVIEIGGGRRPSFSAEGVAEMGVVYTSNDISERELSLAPDWVKRAHFDVATRDPATVAPYAESYDLAFSRMVMEHVSSYEAAYTNIYRILKPGGISICLHPVLYAFPFILNKLLPEGASTRLLTTFFPNRTDTGRPKFPAYYSGCVISEDIGSKIKSIGFRHFQQVPFYGHNYYSKIPGLRDAHHSFTAYARRKNIKTLASFCYSIAVK